jgi:hypothetical protein
VAASSGGGGWLLFIVGRVPVLLDHIARCAFTKGAESAAGSAHERRTYDAGTNANIKSA